MLDIYVCISAVDYELYGPKRKVQKAILETAESEDISSWCHA